MRVPLSVIVIAFVLAEITGFVLVGKALGVLATLGLVFLGMLTGTLLIRHLSLGALRKMRAEIKGGRAPARPIAEAAVLGFGALLILVPGFLSDILGIALFIPAVRRMLWRSLQRRFEATPGRSATAPGERPTVIDLDRSEYGSASSPSVHPDSPWRREEGSVP